VLPVIISIMNDKFSKSLDRAIKLLGTPSSYKSYVVIKIKPISGGCCCFHCWPNTWNNINRFISPCGPIKDEGDVLITKDTDRFVLECHESGPEIIIYLGTITASVLLIKAVTELITVFLKSLQNENRKQPGKVVLTRRRQIKTNIEEEEIMIIEFPIDESIIKKLNIEITNIVTKAKK